jgi:antitoxin CptB
MLQLLIVIRQHHNDFSLELPLQIRHKLGMETPRDIRIKKLRYYSSYRGCKETDILLGNYSREYLPQLNDAELDTYTHFLDEHDQDIWNWVVGREPCPYEAYGFILSVLSSPKAA